VNGKASKGQYGIDEEENEGLTVKTHSEVAIAVLSKVRRRDVVQGSGPFLVILLRYVATLWGLGPAFARDNCRIH
jgi:hypothetical protein